MVPPVPRPWLLEALDPITAGVELVEDEGALEEPVDDRDTGGCVDVTTVVIVG